jgi:hypothetical protein
VMVRQVDRQDQPGGPGRFMVGTVKRLSGDPAGCPWVAWDGDFWDAGHTKHEHPVPVELLRHGLPEDDPENQAIVSEIDRLKGGQGGSPEQGATCRVERGGMVWRDAGR